MGSYVIQMIDGNFFNKGIGNRDKNNSKYLGGEFNRYRLGIKMTDKFFRFQSDTSKHMLSIYLQSSRESNINICECNY